MWRLEVITAAVEDVARSLERAGILAEYYLAGGTGLALQIGHRHSHDLDFFNPTPFPEGRLIEEIRRIGAFDIVSTASHTLHIVMNGVKVSFLAYDYPLLFPMGTLFDVKVADPRDIACMKLSAVASRGTKRDFVDVYAAAERIGLSELLVLFDRKFAGSRYNRVHLLKSLTYFQDAEKDPMPDMLVPTNWESIKDFFSAEAPRLL